MDHLITKYKGEEYGKVQATRQQVGNEVTCILFITPTQVPRARCPQYARQRMAYAIGVHHICGVLRYKELKHNKYDKRKEWIIDKRMQQLHFPVGQSGIVTHRAVMREVVTDSGTAYNKRCCQQHKHENDQYKNNCTHTKYCKTKTIPRSEIDKSERLIHKALYNAMTKQDDLIIDS